jgi:hypothetical protein
MKEYEMGGECGRHGKEEKYIRRFWWENLKEKDPLEKKNRCSGKIIINLTLNKWDGKLRSGFIWLKIGTY